MLPLQANRECILDELVLVAEGEISTSLFDFSHDSLVSSSPCLNHFIGLGKSAIQDLKAVGVRLSSAAKHHREKLQSNKDDPVQTSSAVSLSTSNSELKLLRVLQMLNSLCAQDDETKFEGNPGTEFVSVLQSLKLESLWYVLALCIRVLLTASPHSNEILLDQTLLQGPAILVPEDCSKLHLDLFTNHPILLHS